MPKPDTISVRVVYSSRVEADLADFTVKVTNQSSPSVAAAIGNAREIGQLVTRLQEVGIENGQIRMGGVRIENQDGVLTKPVASHGLLRIEDVPIGKVADTIGVIATFKNASLDHIDWRYGAEETERNALRRACAARAVEQAKSTATALGVKLLGIWEMSQHNDDHRYIRRGARLPEGQKRAQSMISEEILGMAVSHSLKVYIELDFKFRVSEFESEMEKPQFETL